MTQYMNGTSIVSKFNIDNSDFIVAYIRNRDNVESKFGLTARILRINTVKDKKVQSTKSVIHQ